MQFSSITFASVIYFFAAIVLFCSGIMLPEFIGDLRPDYNSISHYISELGARDAQHSKVVNYLGFLPVAIATTVLIFMNRAHLKGFPLARLGLVFLFVGISIGYLGAFLFPCDYGCPIEGSPRQMIHNLAGLIEYPTGTLGLILLGIGIKDRVPMPVRLLVFIVAALSAIGFILMIDPEQAALRGLWQRMADYSMFGLIMFLGIELRNSSRQRLCQSDNQ